MATEQIPVIPGEGVQIDFQVEDTSGALVSLDNWEVTGELLGLDGEVLVADLDTGTVSSTARRVAVRGTQTTPLAGRRAVVKVTGIDPQEPTVPVVREAVLAVGSI